MFKRTIIASAVLLATSSVWAASANNQATVAQTGNNNLATVEQIVAQLAEPAVTANTASSYALAA